MGKTYSMCTHPPGRTLFGSPLALHMTDDVFFNISLNFGRHNICQVCRVFYTSSAPSLITRKNLVVPAYNTDNLLNIFLIFSKYNWSHRRILIHERLQCICRLCVVYFLKVLFQRQDETKCDATMNTGSFNLLMSQGLDQNFGNFFQLEL